MTSWTRRTAKTILLSAGIAAAATALPTAAFASTGPTTSGTGSVASGNQVSIPITIPINVCGNAAALLGVSTAACQGGASVTGSGADGAPRTSGTGSVLSGNQVTAPITAPVDVCGNAVGGNAKAHCPGGATVHRISAASAPVTSGNGAVGSGNQVVAPITAPVDVCGNSVAVLGVAGAGCAGGATVGGGTVGRGASGHGWSWAPQCKCQTGADAITSLLPDYTSALKGLKLTAYETTTAVPANLASLPLVSQLPGDVPGLANLANLPTLSSIPATASLARTAA
jgi:hypothetical protein